MLLAAAQILEDALSVAIQAQVGANPNVATAHLATYYPEVLFHPVWTIDWHWLDCDLIQCQRWSMNRRKHLGLVTETDKRAHQKAISKLRARLFAHRSPEECFTTIEAETILPPKVTVLVDIAANKPIRTVALGGLEYVLLSLPNSTEHTVVSVQHHEAYRFWLFASVGRYTRFAIGVFFSDVERKFLECIDSLALEATQAHEMSLRK